ncbi:TRAP transporter substrate-binding protein [Shewanella sp.]|uniref:TRAP transporter substrate-binding protein n=1 Tax=Shewanella sp. TaxID=50422 RepID=UPI003F3A163A
MRLDQPVSVTRPLKTLVKMLALASVFATSVTAFAAPVEIKFSHVVAENTPKGQMALKFKELVEQRLPGEYKVSVYPNSQLFGDNNELAALLLNDVQLVAPSLSKFERYTKRLQVFDLPFLFNDMAAVNRFQQGEAGQKLLDSMNRKGIVGLGYLHNGMKQFTANTPLKQPTDAKGLKFRVMASDVLAAQFDAVGAIPVKKPFSEVFTLLQTRAIDGQENTWSNTYSQKFYEVQSHITESNHGVLDYMVVTSDTFWKSLPEDKRKIIKGALDESIALGNKIAAEKDNEDKQLILNSKLSQLVTLSPAERQQWVDVMKPVWTKFEDQVGKEVIEAAVAANKQ